MECDNVRRVALMLDFGAVCYYSRGIILYDYELWAYWCLMG